MDGYSMGFLKYTAATAALLIVSACGVRVPPVQEVGEDEAVGRVLPFELKRRVLCEVIDAVNLVNSSPYLEDGVWKKTLPDNYGVQLQINLTFDEKSAFAPGITFTRTLLADSVRGSPVDRFFSLAIGGNLSSTATSTRSIYDYYNVAKLTRNDPNKLCKDSISYPGSSPLLQTSLGIQDYLVSATQSSVLLPSSAARRDGGENKRGIFTYSTKFVIETAGNLTPSFKVVAVSGDGSPFFSAGRTRTHELVLTFSPDEKLAPGEPSQAALQSHFTTQLIQTLNRLNGRP